MNKLHKFQIFRKNSYNWEKLLKEKVLKRNKWLSEIWTDLYFKNQKDEYLRKLSTEELLNTKWFEKYGIKEPSF